MQLKRSVLAAIAVLALSAGFGQAHAALGGEGDDASRIEKKKKKAVIFDHVMIDPLNPGAIVPCVRVLKKYYKKAENHPELVLRISVTYYSNGTSVQKLVTLPLADMDLTHHHEQPADKKWKLVETTLDITDQPIDTTEGAKGTAELLDGDDTIATFTFGH